MERPVPVDLRAGIGRLREKWPEFDQNPATISPENLLNGLTQLALADEDALGLVYNAFPGLLMEVVARMIGIGDFALVTRRLAYWIAVFPEIGDLAVSHLLTKGSHALNDQSTLADLLACYRLLAHDRGVFVQFVNPGLLNSVLATETAEPAVKYMALRLLAQVLEVSENVREEWMKKHFADGAEISGMFDEMNGVDYRFLALIEAKRLARAHEIAFTEHITDGIDTLDFACNSLLVNIGGTLVPAPRRHTPVSRGSSSSSASFVHTSSSAAVLSSLAQALRMAKPVLLTGPTGSGKTYIVNETVRSLGVDDDLIRIHIGDQTDVKSLVGAYTAGAKPGSFEWRPGALTIAVKEGRWVLIEDIDHAPSDVVSVLLPLLEKRELLIASRGETIKAERGFQLIATTTTSDKKTTSGDMIGKRLWQEVTVELPSREELVQILRAQYPMLEVYSAAFVDTYLALCDVLSSDKFRVLVSHQSTRPISNRDLFKWARRVEVLLSQYSEDGTLQTLPESALQNIFAEALDCFAGFIPSRAGREYVAEVIGDKLSIPPSVRDLYLNKHIPQLAEVLDGVAIGRTQLKISQDYLARAGNNKQVGAKRRQQLQRFAHTNHSLRLLEQIGVATGQSEPTLLVGETGTGKTTVIQHLATLLGKKLVAINLSQQTETGDLLGGFKPVDSRLIAAPLAESFDDLFESTFSLKKNEKFVAILQKSLLKGSWRNVIKLWREACRMADETLGADSSEDQPGPKKRRKLDDALKSTLVSRWQKFRAQLSTFEAQMHQLDKSAFYFEFVEGRLVQAVRNGDWVLLDEINLASHDTLESISDLFSEKPSITLLDKGDARSITASPEFRIFAAMNPATDVGKRDLPPSLRSRFTELLVSSPDQDINDLQMIIDQYIGSVKMADRHLVDDIAHLYLETKAMAERNEIVDGANQKPHFSVRTLTRCLNFALSVAQIYGTRVAIYEGYCMSFLTLLDKASINILEPIIFKFLLSRLGNVKSVLNRIPPAPVDGNEYVQFRHYWLKKGRFDISENENYIITPFVERNLLNLARATASRRFPVLIQGPTSSGKTSMINYLAKKTGHKLVRINNHEHTDLQEYLGTYVSDDRGKLTFQEGALAQALRNGYWIVLDELNLAPTDVLEALNRLLDDNRELLIPETQEIIKPHPDFMLFATQNPPGLYGGRKILSRAFRNRFLELHFEDIPEDELETILRERCKIAPSYAKKIVDVYRQLAIQRQSSRVFEKHGFATLRDLFRWASREAVGYEQLAWNGYLLLAERIRKVDERKIVKSTLESVMKVKIDVEANYAAGLPADVVHKNHSVVWTNGMKRLLVLVSEAMKQNEPILLVGETGCGKTTICQILAEAAAKSLHIVNAHQNMETGDIIGAQRPVRNRSEILHSLAGKLVEALSGLPEYAQEDMSDLSIGMLKQRYSEALKRDDSNISEALEADIKDLSDKSQVLFEWADGSLIQALRQGEYFLLDEISLADDSVLERLNSVLEPERTLLLSERGGSADSNIVQAQTGFQFFATMNPGGDFGKKELSPALRNRFTEIWVPSMEDFNDVLLIVESRLAEPVKKFASAVVDFGHWFGMEYGHGDASSGVISLRDMLTWITFINELSTKIEPDLSVFHGACMVFIDALGSNNSASLASSKEVLLEHRLQCVRKLSQLCDADFTAEYMQKREITSGEQVTAGPFKIEVKNTVSSDVGFSLHAPTTSMNALRIIRAMQVKRPILLEGSPGVGKTSIITALAKLSGWPLTRINLSEQTDLIDLFGADAPVEGKSAGEFEWKDAPFLRAMREGEWVLLDEMNLASQSVLEGFNACLDHRGEVYIPELDKTFKCHPDFRVFAAQNPQIQGGGRKGLPKSFLNRFSLVYVDTLTMADLHLISEFLYPGLPELTRRNVIEYIVDLENEVSTKKSFGLAGSPFEFNLRDSMRWLQLLNDSSFAPSAFEYFDLVIRSRFRTAQDAESATKLYEERFGAIPHRDLYFFASQNIVQVGHSRLARTQGTSTQLYNGMMPLQCNNLALETAITCVNSAWPLILIGDTSSGKTSLIRFLASLAGVVLMEFPMNGDIDSTDLLGGFDQVDRSNSWRTALDSAAALSRDVLVSYLASPETPLSNEVVVAGVRLQEACKQLPSVALLSTALTEIVSIEASVFDEGHRARATYLKQLFEKLISESSSEEELRFQWLDGALIRAVEEGHWLVLDNANLCNPSVLDRLNSLLEPNGQLIVSECSLKNGQPRVITPHPNFRLFLTVNPRYGELSRAMRNRGVEVFLDRLETRSKSLDTSLLDNVFGRTLTVKYVGSADLAVRQFATLTDIWEKRFPSNIDALTMSSLNVLTVPTAYSLDDWTRVLKSGQRYFGNAVEFASQLSLILTTVGNSRYAELLRSYYAHPVFANLPCPINPIAASPVLHSQSDFTASELSEALAMFVRFSALQAKLATAQTRSAHVKESQLTYVERSVLVAEGRPVKHKPAILVAPLINSLSLGISDYLSQLGPDSKVSRSCFHLLIFSNNKLTTG